MGDMAPSPGSKNSRRGRNGAPREVAVLLDAVECHPRGSLKIARNGHWKAYMGGRYVATIPASPSDRRSIANTRALLRRQGFTL